MEKWLGAAGICCNENNELLMVLETLGKWTVPTGGKMGHETFEECIIREIAEETGYIAEIAEKLKVKSGTYDDIQIAYEVHYFLVKIIGGTAHIQDPDQLIVDIAWKPEQEVAVLEMNYPEDREYLIEHLKRNGSVSI